MSALDENELDVIFEYYTQKNQVEDFSALFTKPAVKENVKKEQKTEEKPAEDKTAERKPEEITDTDFGMEVVSARKTRVVDTRVNDVDLDRIDNEKLEELVPENVKNESAGKQKIKTGNKKSKLVK